jgi:hypothetical protein
LEEEMEGVQTALEGAPYVQATGSRRTVFRMVLASVLFIAAWQASADTCGPSFSGLRCGPVSAIVAFSQDRIFLTAAAKSDGSSGSRLAASNGTVDSGPILGTALFGSPAAQSASLLLLGCGLALAARSLKPRKSF